MPSRLDRQAIALCQAVHTATCGRAQWWVALDSACLTAGISANDAERVARHCDARGWPALNSGPVLHSVSISAKLWEEIRHE